MRRQETTKPPIEYRPMTWKQATGFNVSDDAEFTAAITARDPQKSRERRLHEIKRLAHFHGKEYASRVQNQVIAIFRDEARLAAAREKFKTSAP